MKGRQAGFIFLVICLILAWLVLAQIITPIVSGCVFAVSLVSLGIFSGGFKKQ
jgi:hypothetical protein